MATGTFAFDRLTVPKKKSQIFLNHTIGINESIAKLDIAVQM